jgi:hypothetical protein
VDEQRFLFKNNPERLVQRLEDWFEFYFQDIVRMGVYLKHRKNPAALRKIFKRQAKNCPDCKRPLIPRIGEKGIGEAGLANLPITAEEGK